MEAILGELALKVFHPGGRRLNTRLPTVRDTYIRLLEQHFSRHELLPKLYRIASSQWKERWRKFAKHVETLDRIRLEGMRFAENAAVDSALGRFSSPRNLTAGTSYDAYTPKLYSNMRAGNSAGQRLARKCDVDHIFRIPPQELRRLFRNADLQYRRGTLKPKSADLRDQFLRSKLATLTPGSPHHQAIATLIHHETQREVFRFLRRLQGIPTRKSVLRVQEMDPAGEIRSFSTRREVEMALQRCLESRFRLTDDSPLMQSYLFELLGSGVLTLTGQQILNGDPPHLPSQFSDYTRWLLAAMAKPHPRPFDTIDKDISVLDFQRYWRKAKEHTSSSISGLHFGH